MTRTCTLELAGGTLVVTPDSLNLATTYVLCEQQDWFEYEISFLRRLLQPGQRAIDVGANYGVYTLSIAKAVGPTGSVWAFEPASTTAALLAQGIAANGFTQVVLEMSALSRECGAAQLTLHDEPELNALSRAEQPSGASETVRVVSLDDCLQRYGWRDIDFIKIDAEGEEANIIEGGRRFLEDLSPLILYEVKAAKAIHLELVHTFAALGFNSYRLVPGLDLLVPFDAREKPDDYLLNLFCCKADRATLLSNRGLLLDASSCDAYRAGNRLDDYLRKHRHEYIWQNKLATLPYGAECAALWESSSVDGAAANDALTCFAVSQDVSLGQLERFNALESSLRSLVSLCRGQPPSLRLASLARVASDYGARSIAVEALRQLLGKLVRDKCVDMGEPFVSPGKRFDSVAPRNNIQDWIFASALEEFERLHAFSSFYTGDSARRRLELIVSLGYESAEMRRRLDLIKARFPKPDEATNPPASHG